ncbi:MAG: ABC transporter permease [Hyphomicrobiales bacterium]|nr:ABC transporter permease [Hyphomicrobiales bacterium]
MCGGLLLCLIVAGLLAPDKFFFLTEGNIKLVLRAITNLGFVGLGVGLLMIAGEFDLSVGSVYVATPFAMAISYVGGVPLPVAIGFAFAIAIGIGLANATITLRLGIPSFITTLGMLFIVRTVAPFIADYRRSVLFRPPPAFKEALTGDVLGVPVQFLWFLGFAAIAYVILNRHFLGNHFFAAGGDARAARFAGINVNRTKTLAFVLASVMATVAGIFNATRVATSSTNPQLFIELFAVAICVIGGVSLFGGRGSVIGIVLGAVVLQLVQDAIILARLPGFYLDMFVGLMIVLGVVLNQAARRKY